MLLRNSYSNEYLENNLRAILFRIFFCLQHQEIKKKFFFYKEAPWKNSLELWFDEILLMYLYLLSVKITVIKIRTSKF